MSGTLDIDHVLSHAEAIFLQLRDCRDLSHEIHEILSLSLPCTDKPFSSELPSGASKRHNPVNHVTQTLHCGEPHGELGNPVESGSVADTSDLTPADDGSIEVLSEAN